MSSHYRRAAVCAAVLVVGWVGGCDSSNAFTTSAGPHPSSTSPAAASPKPSFDRSASTLASYLAPVSIRSSATTRDQVQLAEFAQGGTDPFLVGADFNGLNFETSVSASWTDTASAKVTTYLIEFDTAQHAAEYIQQEVAGLHLTPGVAAPTRMPDPSGCWQADGIGSALPDSAAAGTSMIDCSAGPIAIVMDFGAVPRPTLTAKRALMTRQPEILGD
jgi:hypothetical protein